MNASDNMHEKFTLDNGMKVHLLPYKGTGAATCLVLVKVGSRYEPAHLSGASHFIEHLLFKGTKRRPDTTTISRALDSIGAEFNAYTGKDRTGYYIKSAGSHLPLAIDILHDMIFHSKFVPAEVKRERGVIIEEINMYHDNPLLYVEDLLEQTIFSPSPLGREIAGSKKTMLEMTRKEVIEFYQNHYVPSKMVLVLAGKVDGAKTKTLIKKKFGQVKGSVDEIPVFAPYTVHGKKSRTKVQYKKTKQTQVALGFPSFGRSDERVPAAKLLASILGGTMSSRLFISIRERKGLAYLVRATQSEYEDVGMFMIQSGLDIGRLDLAARTLMRELRAVKKKGVTTEELKRAKDNLRGRVTLALEDSMRRAEFYAEQELFLGKVKSPKQRLNEFDKVTRGEVQKVANEILDFRQMHLAGIGQYKKPEALSKYF